MLKHTFLFINLFIATVFLQASASPLQFSFEKFPYPEKLPSNSVIRIYHDKEGYMWFGTKDGLCRFDGYDVKVFRSSALTPGKLTSNEIQCITEDNHQQLWVGTFEGINIVDKRNYSIKSLDNKFINKERINSMITDSEGYVWIGTSSNGAIRMDPKTGAFERYSADKDSKIKLGGNNVTNIYEDNEGNIWISLWKTGLCYLNTNRTKVTFVPKIGINNNPFRVFQDKSGLYWICTWGDKIFNLTLSGDAIMDLRPMQLSNNSPKKVDDIVYSITQDDKYGLIWIVTYSGLNLIQQENDGSYKVMETNSFFDETATKLFHEIIKDRRGNLWVGSVGEGLYKLDFDRLSIQNYTLREIKSLLNVPSYVTRFCELKTGEVYIVINRIGLFRFDPKTGSVKRPSDPLVRGLASISAITSLSSTNEIWAASEGEDLIHVFKHNIANQLTQLYFFSLSNFKATDENTINTFFEDADKNIWIGTSNGLYVKPLNAKVKLISSKIHFINTIGQDVDKKIWIGTEKEGVFICKPTSKDKRGTYILSKVDLNINSYQSYSVQSICCTKKGDVYIGTKDGCLYFYDPIKQIANDLSSLYGITDEGIMDVVEDNYGMLWISTIKRIIKFNPKSHTATYFSSADGMLISSFFKDARIKLQSGKLLFGGNNGICMFNPAIQNVSPKASSQHVVLSDIQIQNKSIFEGGLNARFNADKNMITLDYSENNLSLEFSALNFSSARKIQYAYKLSGIDNDWNYIGNNRRFVNYANLPIGNYKFMVKASDENGLWGNQITSLQIEILPPYYRTWWAYFVYLLLVSGGLYFASKNVANRIRMKNELRISHIEKEKTEELAQIKLRFFTNISHELLTPLTIIMLLIENLQRKSQGDSTQFDMLKDNVIRLKRLIQQILVFRKTETGNMKLKIKENDIVLFVKNICYSNFHPLVTEKEIKFAIDSDHENYTAYFDADKLDKILYNLLSNAFKHTLKGGLISVKMSFIQRDTETIMRLSVSDSGDGIAEADLPHIFKRFYISKSSDQSQSHGIGLALTSDLLQLHKGSIEVKSQLGEGSVFTIEIPVSAGMYSQEELLEIDTATAEPINLSEMADSITFVTSSNTIDDTEVRKDCNILVVEDNRELKDLIVGNLSLKYTVLSAENGLEALEIVRNNEVDLVISDVMMPEMDGLTFCKKLKNDVATSHINILLLTAKNSTEDRIECYNAGADAYIAKPFELAVLDARTKNLITKRKQKTDSFQQSQEINISSMEYGSIDELFLKQSVKQVEEKLSDDTYDFDKFAIDMATSKSTLHRKLKSLTGLSPGEFIRNIRLKHAALMLTSNAGNISEVAFAVGFNDPKYFSRCFKTEFGLTPREYQESKKKQ